MTQHFDFREGRSQGLVIYPLSRPEGGLCQVNGGGWLRSATSMEMYHVTLGMQGSMV